MGHLNDLLKKVPEVYSLSSGVACMNYPSSMISHLADCARKLYMLCKLSGLDSEEVKWHHRHSALSMGGLLGFYAQHGCFPCEIEPKMGMVDGFQ